MGLFSSKSKSTSTTNVYDNSMTLDLSSGMGGTGASKNIIASSGAVINQDGMSEDLATTIFGGVQSLYSGFTNWVQEATSNTIAASQNQNNAIAKVYGEAYATQKNTIENIKPLIIYGLIALVGYQFIKRI